MGRDSSRLAVGVLGLAVLAVFLPVLPADRVYYFRDVLFEAYPLSEAVGRSLRAGELPLRLPEIGFGQPLLATPAAQVLYPSSLLRTLLAPPAALEAHVILHALLAALGCFLFCRRLGAGAAAAAAGALAFVFSGPFVSYENYAMQVAAAAWLPWVLLLLDRALERPSGRRVALFAAALGLQILSGEAVTALQTATLAAIWAFAVHGAWPLGRRENQRAAGILAVGGLLAAALAAGFLLPFLEYFRLGPRSAGLGAALASDQSLHPLLLFDLALPGLFLSRPYDAGLDAPWSAALHGGSAPFLFAIYLGTAPLALGALGCRGSGRRARALIVVAVACLALALGSRGLLFDLARLLLPWFQVMRYPVKFLLPAAFALAALVALGCERLLSGAVSERATRRLGGVAAALAVLGLAMALLPAAFEAAALALAAALHASDPGLAARQLLAAAPSAALRSGIVLAGVAALALTAARRPGAWPVAGALVALVGFDLGLAHAWANPTAPADLVSARPALVDALPEPRADYRVLFPYRVEAGQVVIPPLRREAQGAHAQLRYLRSLLFPYDNVPFGVRTGIDVDKLGLYPKPFLELDAFLYRRQRLDAEALRLLRRLNTRFVVAQGRLAGLPGLRARALVPNASLQPFVVYEVDRAWPAVYVAGRALRLPRGEATLAALAGEEMAETDVVLHDAPKAALDEPGVAGRCTIVERGASRLAIEAEMDRAGALVVLEHALPGWEARVDGASAPILGANQIFMAVELPPGTHRVELRYRPLSVRIGLSLSALALLGVLFLVSSGSRGRSPQDPSAG